MSQREIVLFRRADRRCRCGGHRQRAQTVLGNHFERLDALLHGRTWFPNSPNNANAEPRFQPKLGVWFRPASLHQRSPASFQPLRCTRVKRPKCGGSNGREYLDRAGVPGTARFHLADGNRMGEAGRSIPTVPPRTSTRGGTRASPGRRHRQPPGRRSAAEARTLLLGLDDLAQSPPQRLSRRHGGARVCVSVARTNFGRAVQHLSRHRTGLSAGALGDPRLWRAAISSSQRPEGQVSNTAPSIDEGHSMLKSVRYHSATRPIEAASILLGGAG